jgi:hypothetical protein
MTDKEKYDRTFAQPWILPIAIVSGLASAYAIPWNYTDVPASAIVTTVVPLVSQFVLASVASVFAFLGRASWFTLLAVTTTISLLNSTLFALDFWGVGLPGLPKVLLVITSLALIPALIWGKKKPLATNPSSSFEMPQNNSEW